MLLFLLPINSLEGGLYHEITCLELFGKRRYVRAIVQQLSWYKNIDNQETGLIETMDIETSTKIHSRLSGSSKCKQIIIENNDDQYKK